MVKQAHETMNFHDPSMLRNVRKIKKLKSKKIDYNIQLNSVENDLIENQMALYMTQTTDNVNLVIESDSDFKLVAKKKTQLHSEYSLRNIKNDFHVNMSGEIGPDSHKNTILHTNNDIPHLQLNNCLVSAKNSCSENKQNSLCIHTSSNNEFKNDLQSLLIMMAINSNIQENVVPTDHFIQIDDVCEGFYIDESKDDANKNNIDLTFTSNDQSKDLVQLLNVKSIIKELNYRERYIAKKIIKKWKNIVKKRKEHHAFRERQETLENFFDKLSKKKNANPFTNSESVQKAKHGARDYNTYHHRYKVQKHIIALQKYKLEEQNKLIEQLKYNNIVEASRQSLDTMRDDVRKTYYEIDRHLKPKIKCLTNELKIKEFEEPSLVLHCLKVPQFLQRMEARAREREEKHAMIRERRNQLEEERIKQKQQAEIAKAEMDKEEKNKRIKELREKRKKEKIENIRKKQHAERFRALIVMADLHYERNLMLKYGIKPFKCLIEIKNDNIDKARSHYRFQLLKNVFLHWMWHTEDMWFDRNYKAQDCYRKKILKKTFNGLKKNHYEFILKKQVADDYYDLYATQLVFRKFHDAIQLCKKEYEQKWKKAVVYYNSNMLFRTFTCWQTLPALNALKREQDIRKLRWREKVLLVVPDYKPPED